MPCPALRHARWVYVLIALLMTISPFQARAQDATPPPAASRVEITVSTSDQQTIPEGTTWTITSAGTIVDSGPVPGSGVATSNVAIPSGDYQVTVTAGGAYDAPTLPFSTTGQDLTRVSVLLTALPTATVEPTAAVTEEPTVESTLEPTVASPATPTTGQDTDILPATAIAEDEAPQARMAITAVGMSCPIAPSGKDLSDQSPVTDQRATVTRDGTVDDDTDHQLDLEHPWQRITMTWDFRVSDAEPGDYVTTSIPAGLQTANQNFPIYAPDGETVIACASVTGGKVTVVFTDYAAEHHDITGDFWIDLNVEYEQTEDDQDYTVNYDDRSVVVRVTGTGPIGPSKNFYKDGWWNREDQGQTNPDGALHWRVTIPQDDSVNTWVMTDTASDGTWTHDCGSVYVESVPGRNTVPASVTCEPNGTLTVTVNGIDGQSLEVHWNASLVEGKESGPFTNSVSAVGDGTVTHNNQTIVVVQTGGGGGSGARMDFSKTATLVNGQRPAESQLQNLRVGDVVTYTLRVVNIGDKPLTDVTVTDNKIDLTCDIGTIEVGKFGECTGTYTITQADADAGEPIVNVATASSNETPDDTDDETVTPGGDPGMTFDKTATSARASDGTAKDPKATLLAGDVVTYTLTVTNTGDITLTRVNVTDSKINLTCDLGTIEVGTSASCTGTYTITQADVDAGDPILNVATADSNETPPTDDDETVTPGGNPAMTLDKTATEINGAAISETNANVVTGDLITYILTATNTGDITLTDVIVTDELTGDTCELGTIAPGASESCQVEYTVAQADVDSGKPIHNVATATTTTQDVPPTNDDEDVPTTQSPGMMLEKIATKVNGTTPVDDQLQHLKVGDVVTYTLTVTNTGNVTLTNVIVIDNLTGNTCTLGTIEVGKSATCEVTYTITQADVEAGKPIVNTAVATSDQTPPDEDTESVTPEKPTTPDPTVTPAPTEPATATPTIPVSPAPTIPVTTTPESTKPVTVTMLPTTGHGRTEQSETSALLIVSLGTGLVAIGGMAAKRRSYQR